MKRTLPAFLALFLTIGLLGAPLAAQGGADVIVGSIPNISNYSSVGGVDAISIGTTSCNIGTANLLWIASTSEHPVIAQHAYRLLNNRFEMIGQSWLKHGFTALTGSLCDPCSGVGGSVLGIGCSDPYGSGLNGSQGGLGPKFEVNAFTGVFPYPYSNPNGSTGNSVFKRLQMNTSDLGASGARYFVEAHYVTADDAAAGNQMNNASYREMNISGGPNNYNFSLTGSTQREIPAIFAWRDVDPSVRIVAGQAPGDGRFHVAFKETDNGNGTWEWEFAVHNLNSHRSARGFNVTVPNGATVTNVGFHDHDYHSGEPYDMTDWTSQVSGNVVSWNTQTFSQNQNANALRWGSTYNFRFRSTMPAPSDVSLQTALDLFRSGGANQLPVNFDPENVLVALSGTGQSAGAGETFTAPLVVQVTAPGGAPLPNIAVNFSPNNSVCAIVGGGIAITDANGFAQVNVVAGATGGTCNVTASTSESSVSFNLSVVALSTIYVDSADILIVSAVTGIPNLRLILAADQNQGIYASNQYGDFYTSVLNPDADIIIASGYADIPTYDPTLITNQSGIFTKGYSGAGNLNGNFAIQAYAVYLDESNQLQVLVTNPSFQTL